MNTNYPETQHNSIKPILGGILSLEGFNRGYNYPLKSLKRPKTIFKRIINHLHSSEKIYHTFRKVLE